MDKMKIANDERHKQVKFHLEMAVHLEATAKMHRDAAQQYAVDESSDAAGIAASSTETDEIVNRRAVETLEQYRQRAEETTREEAERASEIALGRPGQRRHT